MTEDKYEKMWDEILTIAKASASPLLYEKTLKQIQEETGMKSDPARKYVNDLVASGKLKKRRLGNCMYYSPT